MPFWSRKRSAEKAEPEEPSVAEGTSLDEFLGESEGRSASPFDVSAAAKDWQNNLKGQPSSPRDAEQKAKRALALPAFNLIRGGDFFERKGPLPRTPADLVQRYQKEKLQLHENGVTASTCEAALKGVLRVVSGNPAICRRMLLSKPIDVVMVPKGRDYRRLGFPRNTNPNAAGIFYTAPDAPRAMIGLREDHVLSRPWLMVHEMTHAVHLLGMTVREREDIDRMLMPVYRSQRWIEEALAIYAERAFGAKYTDRDLRAPGLYGKTRRDWDSQHVFSRFVRELLRPGSPREAKKRA